MSKTMTTLCTSGTTRHYYQNPLKAPQLTQRK